jgi:hypothetical protein
MKWTVVTKVSIDTVLTFTHEVEADTQEQAEYAAEELIDDDVIYDQMRECDVPALADYDSKASPLTDAEKEEK